MLGYFPISDDIPRFFFIENVGVRTTFSLYFNVIVIKGFKRNLILFTTCQTLTYNCI